MKLNNNIFFILILYSFFSFINKIKYWSLIIWRFIIYIFLYYIFYIIFILIIYNIIICAVVDFVNKIIKGARKYLS